MKRAKLLVLMLTLCMITSCLVGTTVARFVTADSTRDTAQASKWGVVLAVSGDLFGTNYLNAANGNVAAEGDTNVTVRSSSVSALDASFLNVVAPGTQGAGIKLSLSGTPEVAVVQSLEVTSQSIYLAKGIYGEMERALDITEENVNVEIAAGLYINQGSDAAPSYQRLTSAPASLSDLKFYRVKNRFELNTDYYPVVYTAPGLPDVSAGVKTDTLASIAKALAETVAGETLAAATPDVTGKITYSVTGARIPAKTALNLRLDPALVADLENLRIGWSWSIDNGSTDAERAAFRAADTLLGGLTSANLTLVAIDDDGDVSLLKVDAASGVIRNAVGIRMGSLKTSFDLSMSVEQVD